MELAKVNGIGPKTLKLLNNLGINTTFDLVNYYPYRYDFFTLGKLEDISNYSLVKAKIISVPVLNYIKKNFNRLNFNVELDNKIIKVTIFNRAFMKSNLSLGKEIYIAGKYDEKNNSIVASNITFSLPSNMIVPKYHLCNGITNNNISKLINNLLPSFKEEDSLPNQYIKKYNLPDYHKALKVIHNPKSMDEIKISHNRFVYKELFDFTFKVNYLRNINKSLSGLIKKIDEDKLQEFIFNLPFELTIDQLNAINEIKKDMSNTTKMNRLIIGDVGSGKTIVCIIASYLNILAGYQTAFMAPTEVLAIQHFNTINKLFSKYNITCELLTGSMTKKEKEKVNEKLLNNEIDIVIGTHALISESVKFNNLGLIITDEQHRFGVNQRKLLNEKGNNPDAIYLSATPIPRTYALALYGDLDVSLIKTKPSGRKEITTKQKTNKEIKDVLKAIYNELQNNHQVFVVSPLIEDDEDSDLNSVIKLKDNFETAFKNYRVEIMHGKLKNEEKQNIMNNFKEGKIDILISTTVIEVGVDISNATMMVIFDAERFGLATLHQLRGRVGRNDLDCYCYLISDSDTKRLKVLEESNDGFYISEQDFKMRKEGDIVGTKQSGTIGFKVADIIRDSKILLAAKSDSEEYINSKEYLDNNYYLNITKNIDASLD